MGTLIETATIAASKSATWNVLKDFEGIHRWHFNVESSPLSSPNNEGLGATRVIRFYNGAGVTEKIVEYQDGEFMTFVFLDHSFPLKRANATFRVRELAAAETEVIMSLDYAMKYGPLGWLLDKLVLGRTLRKVFKRTLTGLNHHTVTGELIGQNGDAALAAAH